jgi:hypothetical protein
MAIIKSKLNFLGRFWKTYYMVARQKIKIISFDRDVDDALSGDDAHQ